MEDRDQRLAELKKQVHQFLEDEVRKQKLLEIGELLFANLSFDIRKMSPVVFDLQEQQPIGGVHPKKRLEIRNIGNRKIQYLHPAVLTPNELAEIKSHFEGQALEALELLLEKKNNEPLFEPRDSRKDNPDLVQIFLWRRAINKDLDKRLINGKYLKILSYERRKAGVRGQETQLWEIKPK